MFEYSRYKDVSIARGLNNNNGGNVYYYLYVVEGLMFDCGPQCMLPDVMDFVSSQDIKQVAVTHVHEDHCGAASRIAESLNVPIYVPPEAVEEARLDGIFPEYRHVMWGDRPAFPALPYPAAIRTEKYTFEPISTPGHLPTHYAFIEKNQGWLFSGDLYVRTKYRYIDLEENISQLMESLENVLKLDFETVFCTHAGVLEDGKKRLKDKLDYLLQVKHQVQIRREQGFSDRQITNELFPEDETLSLITGGEWNAYNLVHSL